MVSRRDATLNLATLLNHAPDSPDEVGGEGLLEPDGTHLSEIGLRLQGPLAWRLTIRNAGGDDDFLAEGEVTGAALLECRRCLTDVPIPVASSFLYPMTYLPATERLTLAETNEEEEERLLFGHPEVDFGPMLAQLFAIDLPLTALCKNSCKGLSLDGVNLNEYPELEGERSPPTTSPFATLKDLDL
ncbi:MAG: DUF177 domain-containing protein [Truepera sp.]|nr:DUF177 domain-containing protein [Truepera sp.]